jgi:hypothetical protein
MREFEDENVLAVLKSLPAALGLLTPLDPGLTRLAALIDLLMKPCFSSVHLGLLNLLEHFLCLRSSLVIVPVQF